MEMETLTFPPQGISFVRLEEGSGGRSGAEAVHLPALDAGALTSRGQTRPRGPGEAGGEGRGRDTTLLR